MQYKRTHVPTGAEQTFDFNESHDDCFGIYNIQSKEKVTEVARSWIKSWNRAHPELWYYELLETEDAAV